MQKGMRKEHKIKRRETDTQEQVNPTTEKNIATRNGKYVLRLGT